MRLTSMALVTPLLVAFASGCAPVDSTDPAAAAAEAQALAARTCPEVVTPDDRGQPRNTAGHIRYCWPAHAHCYCDQDNDCYALEGYVPCRPRTVASDAGTPDAGHPDAGTADAGSTDAHTADAPVVHDVNTVPDAGTAHDAGTAPVDAGTVPPVVPVPPAGSAATILGGCQVLPLDNPWNQDISALPLNPDSAAIIANIQANGETVIKADFGSNLSYGIPFVVVPASQASVPITFTEYPSESDPGPYPVPSAAPIEGGNDHHVLVLQEGTCRLFEMYHAARAGSGWNAGSGAVFDLSSNALRPYGWTSCDQAGLPILPGLTRYDEVTAGAINHALRVTFNHTRNGWVPPATHPGGSADIHAPAMGMRLRLRASFDVTSYTGESRVILDALKRYGMFVADTGSNWYVSGATDARWDDNDLHQLTTVPGTAFEVVETGAVVQ